jgi:hypothetical protein
MIYKNISIIFFFIIGIQLQLIDAQVQTQNKCNPKKNTGDCLGYYLYDINNISGEGTLYECKNNTKICDVITNTPGYFKVTDANYSVQIPYIQCNDRACKKLAIEDMNNSCDKNTSGELVNIQSNNSNPEGVYLCINYLNLIRFSENTSIYLLDSTTIAHNLFSTPKNSRYIPIAANINSITPMNSTNIDTGTYLINNKLYSIKVNDSNKEFTIDKLISSGIKAFHVEYVGFARLIDDFSIDFSKEYLSKTLLYICQNGRCTSTSGFLKYKSKISGTKVVICMGYCISEQDPNSWNKCDSIGKNKAFYNHSKSTFEICVNAGDNSSDRFEFKKIKADTINYILSLRSSGKTEYELFVSDKGGNIIGLTTGSNYLIDVDGDGVVDMLTCLQNSNFCVVKPLSLTTGYFINSDSNNGNDLIYCNGNSCEVQTENHGYFINSNGEIIRCHASVCELLERIEVGSTCVSHPNEVIYYNNNYNSFQYCNGNTEIDFPDEEFYIALNGIDSQSLDYPVTLNSGTEPVLLKIDQYSVKQVITDSNGICINNKDHKKVNITNCKKPSGTYSKYHCTHENQTCTDILERSGAFKNHPINIYYLTCIMILLIIYFIQH